MKLIPFQHEVNYKLGHTEKINSAFDVAPAALPALVRIGYTLSQVNPKDLTGIQQHIESALPDLDSRIAMEYTITIGSALAVGPLH